MKSGAQGDIGKMSSVATPGQSSFNPSLSPPKTKNPSKEALLTMGQKQESVCSGNYTGAQSSNTIVTGLN